MLLIDRSCVSPFITVWILCEVLAGVGVSAARLDRRLTTERLTIRPQGEVFTKSLGGAMLLTCIANPGHNDVTDLRWWDPAGQEIVDRTGGRRYIEADGNNILKLYITSITPDEEGEYTCQALVGGRQYSKTTTIRLFKDITFENAPSPQYLRVNTTGLVRCVVSAHPEAVVTWRFNDSRVTPGGRYTMTNEGLVISNVSPETDSGVYDCRGAVDEDGRYDVRSIVVAIHEPPRLTKGPGRIEGLEGAEGTISCRATGNPSPVFNFFKNGILLTGSSRVQVDEEGGVGTIRFAPFSKADEGRYRCEAINTVGEDAANGDLVVLVKPVITEFHSVVVSESRPATMTCMATGDPIPDIGIRKAGRQLSYQRGLNDGGRMIMRTVTRGHVEMTWHSATPDDTSEYICIARNRAGVAETRAKLIVNYPPVLASNQSRIDYVWAGVERNITCTAFAEPRPHFEWTRAGRTIVQNDTFRIVNEEYSSFLQIRVRESDQAWIYGAYQCNARNSLGETRVSISVQRASVPDAPRSISVEASLPDAIELYIESPEEDGGMPIIGYRIQHDDVIEDFDDPEGRILIPNLRPSSNYLLRVKARNSVGFGNHVEMKVLTTSVGRPLPVVITSQPFTESPFDYRVTWDLRSSGGLQIDKYQFIISRVYVDDFGNEKVSWRTLEFQADAETQYYDLKNLVPNSYYQLVVRAHNNVGCSDNSPVFVFQTAAAGSHALPNSSGSTSRFASLDRFHLLTSCVITALVTSLLLRRFSTVCLATS